MDRCSLELILEAGGPEGLRAKYQGILPEAYIDAILKVHSSPPHVQQRRYLDLVRSNEDLVISFLGKFLLIILTSLFSTRFSRKTLQYFSSSASAEAKYQLIPTSSVADLATGWLSSFVLGVGWLLDNLWKTFMYPLGAWCILGELHAGRFARQILVPAIRAWLFAVMYLPQLPFQLPGYLVYTLDQFIYTATIIIPAWVLTRHLVDDVYFVFFDPI